MSTPDFQALVDKKKQKWSTTTKIGFGLRIGDSDSNWFGSFSVWKCHVGGISHVQTHNNFAPEFISQGFFGASVSLDQQLNVNALPHKQNLLRGVPWKNIQIVAIRCCMLHTYIYKYVCMHVCMHACMHVGMYVCMYVCIYLCIYLCIYVSMYLCIYVIYVSIYVYSYVRTYLCMYVRTYVCT